MRVRAIWRPASAFLGHGLAGRPRLPAGKSSTGFFPALIEEETRASGGPVPRGREKPIPRRHEPSSAGDRPLADGQEARLHEPWSSGVLMGT